MNAGEMIDDLVSGLNDWRGETVAAVRRAIHEADPQITEEWKWRGSPAWSHDGLVCLTGVFKNKVKVTFYQGAKLPDPDRLFNSELEGRQWRAIDYYQGDDIRERDFGNLIRAAVAFNQEKTGIKAKPEKTPQVPQSES